MRKTALFLSLCVFISAIAGCGAQKQETPETVTEVVEETVESGDTKTITDMKGKEVEIPQNPERVAILDKGFLVQTMRALGVTDRICATGGLITEAGDPEERDSLYLFPEIMELPIIGYPTDAVDFETLAGANPDLVILRNSEYIKDSEITADAISRLKRIWGCRWWLSMARAAMRSLPWNSNMRESGCLDRYLEKRSGLRRSRLICRNRWRWCRNGPQRFRKRTGLPSCTSDCGMTTVWA